MERKGRAVRYEGEAGLIALSENWRGLETTGRYHEPGEDEHVNKDQNVPR